MERHEPPGNVTPISPLAVLLAGLLAGGSLALCVAAVGGVGGVLVGLVSAPVVLIGVLIASYVWARRRRAVR